MYIRKRTVRKPYSPVRASKKKARLVKRFFLIILVLLLCFGAYFGVKRLAAMAFAVQRPSWMEWRLKKINISGAEGDIEYEVSKYISFNEGDTVTSADVDAMKALILGSMKQISSVRAYRNYFTKELNIKIKRKPAAAAVIIDGKTFYVNKEGLIFKDEPLPQYGAFVPVSVFGVIKDGLLPQEIVELFQEVNAAKDIKFKEVYLDLDAETLDIILEDLTRVRMGGLKDTAAKLANLKAVLTKAENKNFKKPYTINLKYFKDGKIYLKS